ncbi:hypothetical protein [Edaphobacter modestus]|uniref:Nickel/cobalt transporter regulator n=1 Tax=Edaphobacter modestus TaxID=388466 RepID=A0A4Q7Z0M3_9BACT|nr:hypothetical protein [Edaphobacter modestus]RZU43710.1 hypothetical protein BDD14_5409 [Edaphobacter modestus]
MKSGHGMGKEVSLQVRISRFLIASVLLIGTAAVVFAQGPPGRDPYNPPPGHGGIPPGQAKKQGYGHVPPGQAKKYDDWRFRQNDRSHFYSHYRHDADHWKGKKRPMFVRGQALPRGYTIQPVPRSYWQGVPPPPPGYQYGYSDGYVVAYDPMTRIVADVMDLVNAAVSR